MSTHSHRSKYYDTNTDPRGPFYASAQGIAGAVGNFVTGIFNIPMHTVQGISHPQRSRFADGFGLPTCQERIAAMQAREAPITENQEPYDVGGLRDSAGGLSTKETASTSSSTSSQDAFTMAKRSTLSSMLSNSNYTGRRVVNWIIEVPVGLTLLLSQGFHDAPRWYHDRTVKDKPYAHDIRSGLKAAATVCI